MPRETESQASFSAEIELNAFYFTIRRKRRQQIISQAINVQHKNSQQQCASYLKIKQKRQPYQYLVIKVRDSNAEPQGFRFSRLQKREQLLHKVDYGCIGVEKAYWVRAQEQEIEWATAGLQQCFS